MTLRPKTTIKLIRVDNSVCHIRPDESPCGGPVVLAIRGKGNEPQEIIFSAESMAGVGPKALDPVKSVPKEKN